MSAQGECPERAAVETLTGNVRSGRVVDCRPVEFLTVELEDGHTLTVPEHEAESP